MIELFIGFAGGILMGATGMGLGVVITPLLILTGYRPAVAVATALGLAAVSKIAGVLAHRQLGHWPGRKAWIVVVGGIGGVLGTWLLVHTWRFTTPSYADLWLKRGVAVAILLAAFALLVTGAERRRERPVERDENRAALLLAGLSVGPVEALTSVGSGSLLGPLLVSTTGWTVPQLATVGNLFGWVVAVMSATLYSRVGCFNAPLFVKVMIGLMPGVLAGVFLSRRIERRWYARFLGVIGVCLALRLLL
jgi:uncharacterized membrane protein YfcA